MRLHRPRRFAAPKAFRHRVLSCPIRRVRYCVHVSDKDAVRGMAGARLGVENAWRGSVFLSPSALRLLVKWGTDWREFARPILDGYK